jgi:hypothetical protein
VGVGRISVVREPKQLVASGYRDALEREPFLLIRFNSFTWFKAVMLLFCGGPLALMIAGRYRTLSAVLIAYALAAILLNRAEIRVERGQISSRLRPFPIWPAKSIPVAGITHLIATQSVEAKHGSESNNVQWYVVALTDDTQLPITRQLRTREEAIFVARTIEEHLGLSPSTTYDDD